MCAIEIDVSARAPETVCALWFEGQGLALFKQDLGAGFHFLTERVFGWATGTVTGLGAIPADQSQSDPFNAAIPEPLQLERVAIDCDHVSNWGGDASCIGLFAQIGRFLGQVAGAASREAQSREDRKNPHA